MTAEPTDAEVEAVAEAIREYDLDELTYSDVNSKFLKMHVGPHNSYGIAYAAITVLDRVRGK